MIRVQGQVWSTAGRQVPQPALLSARCPGLSFSLREVQVPYGTELCSSLSFSLQMPEKCRAGHRGATALRGVQRGPEFRHRQPLTLSGRARAHRGRSGSGHVGPRERHSLRNLRKRLGSSAPIRTQGPTLASLGSRFGARFGRSEARQSLCSTLATGYVNLRARYNPSPIRHLRARYSCGRVYGGPRGAA